MTTAVDVMWVSFYFTVFFSGSFLKHRENFILKTRLKYTWGKRQFLIRRRADRNFQTKSTDGPTRGGQNNEKNKN